MDYRQRFRLAAIACANGILGTIATLTVDAGPLLTAIPLAVAVISADQMRRNFQDSAS